jgi:V8-like Glu-specific endopeptidase
MRILILVLLALVAGCGGCVSVPGMGDLESMTLRLFAANAEGGEICSGTKTGPAELTTAKHCVDGMQLKLVNGLAVEVASVRYEGDDEAVVTLTKPMFTHWAKRGPTPKQGDRIRYWGNPLGIPGVYREGIVVAVTDKVIAADLQVCHGDSGAGLWNDKGEMVGVVTSMLPEQNNCAFMVAQR